MVEETNQMMPLEETEITVEKELPEVIYKKAKNRRKRKLITGLACLLVVETVVAGAMGYEVVSDDIQTRVLREYEYHTEGKIQTEFGTYTGDLDFGWFDGIGEFVFDTGAVYTGEWKTNIIQGLGTLKVPIEGVYEGDFVSGKKEGSGIISWDDGDVYDGEWKDDQMCGQGTYTTADNVVYTGTFENNTFKEGNCAFENGTGTYTIKFNNSEISTAEIDYKDGTTYSGTCTLEGITGLGTMTFANSDSYSGEIVSDKRSGKGTYTWKSGESYDGDWLDDDMSGTGTYTYSDGNYATGKFEKNVFIDGTYHLENDFGTYDFTIEEGTPTSVEMTLNNGTKYSGGMADGKLNGTAQITYSNGDTYSGQVKDNQKSGQGSYKWKSGASYDGSWSEDKMSGAGTYMYPESETGYKLEGSFSEGKPDGECTYYISSSESYKTDWSKGKCIKVYE